MTEAAFDACVSKILIGDKMGLREIYDDYLQYIYQVSNIVNEEINEKEYSRKNRKELSIKRPIITLYIGKWMVAAACLVIAIGALTLQNDLSRNSKMQVSEASTSDIDQEEATSGISQEKATSDISQEEATSGISQEANISFEFDVIDSIAEVCECSSEDAMLIMEILEAAHIESPHSFERKGTGDEIPSEIKEKYGEAVYAVSFKDYYELEDYTLYILPDVENNRVEAVAVVSEDIIIFEK